MFPSFDLASGLESAVRAAAQAAGLDGAAFLPEVRGTADPAHGDFQANGVLGYARQAKTPPRPVAEKLVAALSAEVREHFEVAVAGPGFINFTLKPAALLAWLRACDTRATFAVAAPGGFAGRTVVVDYGSPNTAKQLHVGHLRSTVIGEALCRLLAFGGAKVVGDNHVGDWGTQFGKLIWAYKRSLDKAAATRDPIGEFERLYKSGNAAAEADPVVMNEVRTELVKLQDGDPENRAIWSEINSASLAAFGRIYERLGVRFVHSLGESFYNDKVRPVYAELTEAGLAVESEGALVVFHPGHPRFKTQPFIIRKSDGAANYASSDLATVLYRTLHFHAGAILYVVDSRQRDHFEQLFLTVQEWFKATHRAAPDLRLVDFGLVMGDNGKPLKTRSGENVKLQDLLDEAVQRAGAIVAEKSPDFSEAERREIAAVVGVGSVQYADLSQNRSSDYVFSWDKMISLEGNTAAYLLYAVARVRSIFRKHGMAPGAPETESAATPPATPAEIALARKLARFAESIRQSIETLRPHFLCLYLYELAGEFSAFYSADKVLTDDLPTRSRRLILCSRTLLTLETGLDLLGIRTLERM